MAWDRVLVCSVNVAGDLSGSVTTVLKPVPAAGPCGRSPRPVSPQPVQPRAAGDLSEVYIQVPSLSLHGFEKRQLECDSNSPSN